MINDIFAITVSPPPPSSRARSGKANTPVTPTASTAQQIPATDIDEKEELASLFMQPNVGMNSPLQQDNFSASNGNFSANLTLNHAGKIWTYLN